MIGGEGAKNKSAKQEEEFLSIMAGISPLVVSSGEVEEGERSGRRGCERGKRQRL